MILENNFCERKNLYDVYIIDLKRNLFQFMSMTNFYLLIALSQFLSNFVFKIKLNM